jgi:hypothetical protein
MVPEQSHPDEERGRVLPFVSRRAAGGSRNSRRDLPVEDVGKYASDGEEDDFRHRMKTNAVAFLVVVLLVVCGYWLADTMAQMRKDQDCVLSGRRGCTPVTVAPAER